MRHAAIVVLFVLLPGCYESFSVRSDGGPPGDAASSDAALNPDAANPDARVGPTPTDAGDTRGVCERGEIVPPYAGPGCAAETLGCLEACGGDPTAPPGCSEACLAADPECVTCFNQTIIACSNRSSCQAEWNLFACCAETRCPTTGEGIDRLACAETGACLSELDAYATCADGGGFAACNMEIQRCFEP